jgi:hypothetical protein
MGQVHAVETLRAALGPLEVSSRRSTWMDAANPDIRGLVSCPPFRTPRRG